MFNNIIEKTKKLFFDTNSVSNQNIPEEIYNFEFF